MFNHRLHNLEYLILHYGVVTRLRLHDVTANNGQSSKYEIFKIITEAVTCGATILHYYFITIHTHYNIKAKIRTCMGIACAPAPASLNVVRDSISPGLLPSRVFSQCWWLIIALNEL